MENNSEPPIPVEDLMKELGITQEELDEAKDTVIE